VPKLKKFLGKFLAPLSYEQDVKRATPPTFLRGTTLQRAGAERSNLAYHAVCSDAILISMKRDA
jgi:hypothetical protein